VLFNQYSPRFGPLFPRACFKGRKHIIYFRVKRFVKNNGLEGKDPPLYFDYSIEEKKIEAFLFKGALDFKREKRI